MNSDKNVGREPGRHISMELTAECARVTNLSLRGSRLVLTIEAELSESHVEATNDPLPAFTANSTQNKNCETHSQAHSQARSQECACASHTPRAHAAESGVLAATTGLVPNSNSAEAVFSGGHSGHADIESAAETGNSYAHMTMGSESLQPPASAYMPASSMDPHDPAFTAEHTREIPARSAAKAQSMDPHDPAFTAEHTREFPARSAAKAQSMDPHDPAFTAEHTHEFPARSAVKAQSMDPHDPAFGVEGGAENRFEEQGKKTELNDTQAIPGMGTGINDSPEVPEGVTDNSETQPLDPTALATMSEQHQVPVEQGGSQDDQIKALFANEPKKDTSIPDQSEATDTEDAAQAASKEESARFLNGLAAFEAESQLKEPIPAAEQEDSGPLAIAEESSALGGDRHGEPLPTMSFGMGDPHTQSSSQLSFQDRDEDDLGSDGTGNSDTGGTTVLIRYTCPKCKTQGMQAVDKVGTVVHCSNCGKAMRLVMKK